MIIDLSSRLQTAFGYAASNVAMKLLQNGFAEVVENDGNYGLEVFGTDASETFDEVTLRRDVSGKQESYLFAYRSMSDDYQSVFATPPMLSLRREKKLIITPIDNSDIEVVERYGTQPYEITWKGLLIDMDNHNFPIDKFEKINEIFEVNGVWNVDSEILNRAGVKAVYVRNIAISFLEGFEDTIAYTLVLRAIKDLEYQYTN